jgi:hypothetical protein
MSVAKPPCEFASDEWRALRDLHTHEDNLLNDRMNYTIAGQAFLVGAYATFRSSSLWLIPDQHWGLQSITITIAALGILFALNSIVGVAGAIAALRGIRARRMERRADCVVAPITIDRRLRRILKLSFIWFPLITIVLVIAFWSFAMIVAAI